MEIKLMDFKQPLEKNVNLINRNEEQKTNNFDAKLKEVNKKDKNLTESKVNEKMKEIKDSKDLEVVEEETPKKEENVLFQGMINLINIMPEIKEDVEVEDVIASEMLIETDKQINSEILIEKLPEEIKHEDISLVNKDIDNEEIKVTVPKEFDVKEKANLNQTPAPEELKVVQMPIEQKKLEQITKIEKTEELLVSEEANLLHNNTQIIKEGLNEFENQSQSKNSKSDKEFELVEATVEEKSSKVEDKSFVPIMKDGIKFSTDKPIEVEPELPIEPKEVLQQIVQKVKFDLSENKNEIKLTLKPEALGEMTMNIEVAKDGVIAKIMVDNHRAKEIIETNIFQLKEGIKDTVLEIKTFEVFVGSGSDFDKHNSQQFDLKQNSKKIRIKKEDNKRVENYGEQLIENSMNSINIGSESSMNLQA